MKWYEIDEEAQRAARGILRHSVAGLVPRFSESLLAAARFLEEHADGPVVSVKRITQMLDAFASDRSPEHRPAALHWSRTIADRLDVEWKPKDIDLGEGGEL